MVGSTGFLSSFFKIKSLQIEEKIGVKNRKNIWTKLPPSFNFSGFFSFSFFLLTFPFSDNAGILFFSFFFFLSLVLSRRGGSSSFPSF